MLQNITERFIGCVRFRQFQVIAQRAIENIHPLTHHADGGTKIALSPFSNVCSTNRDLTLLYIPITAKELN
ncbi:Uncharacterised protein [Vibrio cholerae]|nr:Uncharacterised protein [Vibrio cholerae]